LFKVPQVVCYKAGWLFYNLAKLVVKVKYISLVNLIMDKEIVKELIQSELNTYNLTKELSKVITPKTRQTMLHNYEELHQKLGGIGASKRAAKLIVGYLKQVQINP